MKVLKHILRISAVAAIVLLTGSMLQGCRSQKEAASGNKGEGEAVAAGVGLQSRYTLLTESWKPWRDVEMGVKVQLTSPARINASGKAYMKRGEWISLSIRMLGFEVATLWVDRDSVVAVDKYHKKYLSEPTEKLLGSAGVTIENIQDVLMWRAFIAGKGTASAADRKLFDLEQAVNGWYLLPRQQPESYSYGFLASDTSNALRGAVVEIKGHGTVSANYNDIFESRTCGWFAQEVQIENSAKKKIGVTLKWDINGSRFNTGLTRSCRIPEGYERIKADALSKLLKNF